MKFLALAIILFIPLTVSARMGENREECLERYGNAHLECDGEYQVDYSLFEKSIYKIHANFWGGVIHQMGYTKDTELTDLEIKYILKVNAGKNKWKRIDDSTWISRNGLLTAVKEDAWSLTIFTTKYARYYWDSKKQEVESEELADLRGL